VEKSAFRTFAILLDVRKVTKVTPPHTRKGPQPSILQADERFATVRFQVAGWHWYRFAQMKPVSEGTVGCLADMRGVESPFRERGRRMAEARAAKKKAKSPQQESVRPLISAGRIQKRIRALAKEIRGDFPDERLHLVSVLKGGVFFLTDLARSIPGEVSFDFIAVASYGQNTHSSGQVRLTRDLDSSIEGRTVIVVEDILDTGMTLQYLLRLFQQRKPKHLRVAVLLDKPERRIAAVRADYVGFSIPNEFVVGYGLDYSERYRNLPYVGILTLGNVTNASTE